MALQGALDAFALADVLQLLGSTRKTGRLVVRASRGVGGVWLDDGAVSAVEAPGVPSGTDVVVAAVHLLRCGDGTFSFEPDEDVPAAMAAVPVEELLAEADVHLARWDEVAERIPTPDEVVHLPADLPADEVVVPARVWPVVLAGARGCTVTEVADALGCSEYEATMLVADALDVGVVALGHAVDEAHDDPVASVSTADDPWWPEAPAAFEPAAADDEDAPVDTVPAVDDRAPDHRAVEAAPLWPDTMAGEHAAVDTATGFDAGTGVDAGVVAVGGAASAGQGGAPWSTDGGVWTDGDGAQWSDGTAVVGGSTTDADLVAAPLAAAQPAATPTSRWSPPDVEPPTTWSALPPPSTTARRMSSEYTAAPTWSTPTGVEIPGGPAGWDDTAPSSWDATRSGWDGTTAAEGSWETGYGRAEDPMTLPADDEPVSLGQLTPQAARAIAAAASATTTEELEAAIAEAIAVNDHPLSRTTLLRFLDSVRR